MVVDLPNLSGYLCEFRVENLVGDKKKPLKPHPDETLLEVHKDRQRDKWLSTWTASSMQTLILGHILSSRIPIL